VGTGGGGPLTFNISSGAALVAAAAGAKVAKHGNRAVTSLCGAADVLEALGVPIELGPELAVECLRETGFMFPLCAALSPGDEGVGPLRRALGFRTIFNLCGPLTNPGRGAGAGDRRAGAQPRAAGGADAGGAGSKTSLRRARHGRHRRADDHRRVDCGARRRAGGEAANPR
jgi:hypothetical protein